MHYTIFLYGALHKKNTNNFPAFFCNIVNSIYAIGWLYKGSVAKRAVASFLLNDLLSSVKLLHFFPACLDLSEILIQTLPESLRVPVFYKLIFFKKDIKCMNELSHTDRQQKLKKMLFFFGKFTFLHFCSNASERIP